MVLTGAYVQAWVWIENPYAEDSEPIEPTLDQFRKWAQQRYHEEGEIEIDDNAKISFSYEDS